jgi:hypothetical protein
MSNAWLYAASSTYPQFQLPNILRTQVTGWDDSATQSLSAIPRVIPDFQPVALEPTGLRSVMPTYAFEAQMMPSLMMINQPVLPPAAVQAAFPFANMISFARYT